MNGGHGKTAAISTLTQPKTKSTRMFSNFCYWFVANKKCPQLNH